MENFTIKRCQYCNNELLVTDKINVCDDCGAVHHKTCWMENGGCLTPGCSEQAGAKTEPEPPVQGTAGTEAPEQPLFCAHCHAFMKQDGKFFQRCGSPIGEGEHFCQKRGLSVGVPGVVSVPTTEAAVKKKKKKTIMISAIIAAVVLVLAAGGIVAAVMAVNY